MTTDDRNVLSSIRERFASSGLVEPPIPNDFAVRLHEFEEPLMWSTRTEVHDLYDFRGAVVEAGEDGVADYLAFGHAGHGGNSWAVSYHFVHGRLKLLLQIPWGGVYETAAGTVADLARVAQAFERAAELIAAFDALDDPDVAVSVFFSGFWGGKCSVKGPISRRISQSIGGLLHWESSATLLTLTEI